MTLMERPYLLVGNKALIDAIAHVAIGFDIFHFLTIRPCLYDYLIKGADNASIIGDKRLHINK